MRRTEGWGSGKAFRWWRRALPAFMLMVALAAPALASGTLMNLYIEKETLSEEQTLGKDIRSKNGELLVTRQSVYPWDEAGSRWAVFVELQNTTDDMIVIDETWLYTCRADKETTATWHFPYMDGGFYRTANRVAPGERTILYAGSKPVYEQVRDENGAYVGEQIYAEGLEPIAWAMRGAKLLRVRMDTRNSQSPSTFANLTQISVPVEGETRVEDGKLYLTVQNATDEEIPYYALGAVLNDARGCIVDVLEEKLVTLAPGGERDAAKGRAALCDGGHAGGRDDRAVRLYHREGFEGTVIFAQNPVDTPRKIC